MITFLTLSFKIQNMEGNFSLLSTRKAHSVKKKNDFHTQSNFPLLCTHTHSALVAERKTFSTTDSDTMCTLSPGGDGGIM